LAEHSQDQENLRSNPLRIEIAIDEFMHAYGKVTSMHICKKETEIRGVMIMPGDRVSLSAPLASRDPAEYDNADTVRLNRRPRLLSFGAGRMFVSVCFRLGAKSGLR
jgi:cytochrome P450